MSHEDLLTGSEHEVISLLGRVAVLMSSEVIGNKRTREQDVAEMVHHIHVLQQMVLSQAAARAFPTWYRLLGEVL
jgi:hypothetical protein